MGIFGALHSSLLDLLVCLALLYILYRIPTWILTSIRAGGGGGRSMVGSLLKGLIMAKTFGMITGRHHTSNQTGISRSGASMPARTGASRDPAWPARVHHWYGPGGPRSHAAVEQRMRAWQASERAHRRAPSTIGPARFTQPSPGMPTHDLATQHATTNPGMPSFRTAHPATTPRVFPAPTGPSPARFQAPPGARPAPPVIRTATVPAPLRFHPPTPPAPIPVLHARTAPAAPAFQAPGDQFHHTRRARTQTPTPITFPAPRPAPPTAPATPVARAAQATPRPTPPPASPVRVSTPRPAPAAAVFSSPPPTTPKQAGPRRPGGDRR